MKIHILAKIEDGPSGGGNHFLKNLRDEFILSGVYCEHVRESDVVIINSHNSIVDFPNAPELVKGKKVVHRMDGLQKLYNHPNDDRQDKAIYLNELLADYTIFQSEWSKIEYTKLRDFGPCSVIHNAASKEFYPIENKKINRKYQLVNSSWSSNPNKGFNYLRLLDERINSHLFGLVHLNYIGAYKALSFLSSTSYPVSKREDLAEALRKCDIYFHPAKFEACSNALLEGLASGLPCVYINSGSNAEIVGEAGEWFNDENDMTEALFKVIVQYDYYRSKIKIKSMKQISEEYIEVCRKVSCEN